MITEESGKLTPSDKVAEIIPGTLYWISDYKKPTGLKNCISFSVEGQLTYMPFFSDFGPFNLSSMHRFVVELDKKLKDQRYKDHTIIHLTSVDSKERTRAAFLMGAFQIIVLNRTAEEAYSHFDKIRPEFLAFRDAAPSKQCSFPCTVIDCLNGLEYAIKLGWYNFKKFDAQAYDFWEKDAHGQMNWIVPGKFMALPSPVDCKGMSPIDYVPVFKKFNITAIVRLNNPRYDAAGFTNNGIRHYEVFFKDGSTPLPEKYMEFIKISEAEAGVAVHCMAGLGRTGTMIAMYVMKHYHFPGPAFIGWIRICRPGSVLGPQQHFIIDKQDEMFNLQSDIWASLPEETKIAAERIARYKKVNIRMNEEELKVFKNGQIGQAEGLAIKNELMKKVKA
jgi:cell division cycle 14